MATASPRPCWPTSIAWRGARPAGRAATRQAFSEAEIRPLDVEAMGALEYDITRYQPVLFGGESMEEIAEVVGGYFASAGV